VLVASEDVTVVPRSSGSDRTERPICAAHVPAAPGSPRCAFDLRASIGLVQRKHTPPCPRGHELCVPRHRLRFHCRSP
jgi:hypothetical protein